MELMDRKLKEIGKEQYDYVKKFRRIELSRRDKQTVKGTKQRPAAVHSNTGG